MYTDLITEDVLFLLPDIHAFNPVRIFSANPIEKIFWGHAEIQAAIAHLYFTSGSSIQHSLHLLKYKGRKEIGFYFGQRLRSCLKQSHRFDDCEIIIPLPLYTDREKKEDIIRPRCLQMVYQINSTFRSSAMQ